MEEWIEWRGQSESQTGREEKKNGRLVGAAETSKERAEWRRLQRKNLNILGLLKRKEWPQCHRESSWQVRRSRPCQEEKEQSFLSRVPNHEGGKSQGGRELHLGEREGIKEKAWRGKGGLAPPGHISSAHRARKDGARVRMNVTAHQEKKKNEETKKGKSRAGEKKK